MHKAIPDLKDQYEKGKMTRREFLRYASLLGMSLGAAQALIAGCAPPATEVPPTEVPPTPTTAPAVPTPTTVPAGPRRGGTLRVRGNIGRIDHPARFSWVANSNPARHVAEYLTLTDENNITHPYLLDSWEASDDLLTWTLNLRQGIKWNNGDDFVADDVVFTMEEWLDEEVGSSTLGLMSYLTEENIEKVNDHTITLHLDSPQIAVPEHLFHYPNQIMNYRTFEGDFIQAPVGTGPYTLDEYSEGERVVLKARADYWQTGADGQPLPYLDEMVYIDLGEEVSAWIAAFQGGEIDAISEPEATVFLALQDDPNANIMGTPTGQTRVLRMRVDKEPWTDNNVRMALKLCQDHEKILAMAHFGEGAPGADFHVAPVHPAYCERPIPPYDPDRARSLLEKAGYADGLTVEIAVASDWTDVVSYAEILKQDAAPAGFDIQINTMPVSAYWDLWTEVDLGVTPWTHRPLGTMVLSLAYTCDDEGEPVPWNETRWCDDEFTSLLTQAEGTLDVEERRQIMCQLEEIQYERGSIGIPYWQGIWMIAHKKVQNWKGHPTQYDLFNELWLEEA
ncbi:MAG: hypothetical protein CEE40_00150 [Chloroflexi bacterium B3_Chlor]|nr:MAG: hypothetical protein CEE40_00150 [Chloroflexi bacterium B3_Chlor]